MAGSLAVAGQRITAAWMNQNIPGAWTPITPQNGWTNHGSGSPTFQARFLNSAVLQIIGNLNPGTTTSGTVIGTLPNASMFPISTQQSLGVILTGTGAGSPFEVTVFNNGAIEIGALGGATYVSINILINMDV